MGLYGAREQLEMGRDPNLKNVAPYLLAGVGLAGAITGLMQAPRMARAMRNYQKMASGADPKLQLQTNMRFINQHLPDGYEIGGRRLERRVGKDGEETVVKWKDLETQQYSDSPFPTDIDDMLNAGLQTDELKMHAQALVDAQVSNINKGLKRIGIRKTIADLRKEGKLDEAMDELDKQFGVESFTARPVERALQDPKTLPGSVERLRPLVDDPNLLENPDYTKRVRLQLYQEADEYLESGRDAALKMSEDELVGQIAIREQAMQARQILDEADRIRAAAQNSVLKSTAAERGIDLRARGIDPEPVAPMLDIEIERRAATIASQQDPVQFQKEIDFHTVAQSGSASRAVKARHRKIIQRAYEKYRAAQLRRDDTSPRKLEEFLWQSSNIQDRGLFEGARVMIRNADGEWIPGEIVSHPRGGKADIKVPGEEMARVNVPLDEVAPIPQRGDWVMINHQDRLIPAIVDVVQDGKLTVKAAVAKGKLRTIKNKDVSDVHFLGAQSGNMPGGDSIKMHRAKNSRDAILKMFRKHLGDEIPENVEWDPAFLREVPISARKVYWEHGKVWHVIGQSTDKKVLKLQDPITKVEAVVNRADTKLRSVDPIERVETPVSKDAAQQLDMDLEPGAPVREATVDPKTNKVDTGTVIRTLGENQIPKDRAHHMVYVVLDEALAQQAFRAWHAKDLDSLFEALKSVKRNLKNEFQVRMHMPPTGSVKAGKRVLALEMPKGKREGKQGWDQVLDAIGKDKKPADADGAAAFKRQVQGAYAKQVREDLDNVAELYDVNPDHLNTRRVDEWGDLSQPEQWKEFRDHYLKNLNNSNLIPPAHTKARQANRRAVDATVRTRATESPPPVRTGKPGAQPIRAAIKNYLGLSIHRTEKLPDLQAKDLLESRDYMASAILQGLKWPVSEVRRSVKRIFGRDNPVVDALNSYHKARAKALADAPTDPVERRAYYRRIAPQVLKPLDDLVNATGVTAAGETPIILRMPHKTRPGEFLEFAVTEGPMLTERQRRELYRQAVGSRPERGPRSRYQSMKDVMEYAGAEEGRAGRFVSNGDKRIAIIGDDATKGLKNEEVLRLARAAIALTGEEVGEVFVRPVGRGLEKYINSKAGFRVGKGKRTVKQEWVDMIPDRPGEVQRLSYLPRSEQIPYSDLVTRQERKITFGQTAEMGPELDRAARAVLGEPVVNLIRMVRAREDLPIIKIISGGQTGVDEAGLLVGRDLGIETGGSAPEGWLREGGADRETLEGFGLQQYREHKGGKINAAKAYRERTIDNVQKSDGTILIAENPDSPGSKLTREVAKREGKPFLEITDPDRYDPEELLQWVKDNGIEVLNVAGNREKASRGIGTRARNLLGAAFGDGEGGIRRAPDVPETQVLEDLTEVRGGRKSGPISESTSQKIAAGEQTISARTKVIARFTENGVYRIGGKPVMVTSHGQMPGTPDWVARAGYGEGGPERGPQVAWAKGERTLYVYEFEVVEPRAAVAPEPDVVDPVPTFGEVADRTKELLGHMEDTDDFERMLEAAAELAWLHGDVDASQMGHQYLWLRDRIRESRNVRPDQGTPARPDEGYLRALLENEYKLKADENTGVLSYVPDEDTGRALRSAALGSMEESRKTLAAIPTGEIDPKTGKSINRFVPIIDRTPPWIEPPRDLISERAALKTDLEKIIPFIQRRSQWFLEGRPHTVTNEQAGMSMKAARGVARDRLYPPSAYPKALDQMALSMARDPDIDHMVMVLENIPGIYRNAETLLSRVARTARTESDKPMTVIYKSPKDGRYRTWGPMAERMLEGVEPEVAELVGPVAPRTRPGRQIHVRHVRQDGSPSNFMHLGEAETIPGIAMERLVRTSQIWRVQEDAVKAAADGREHPILAYLDALMAKARGESFDLKNDPRLQNWGPNGEPHRPYDWTTQQQADAIEEFYTHHLADEVRERTIARYGQKHPEFERQVDPVHYGRGEKMTYIDQEMAKSRRAARRSERMDQDLGGASAAEADPLSGEAGAPERLGDVMMLEDFSDQKLDAFQSIMDDSRKLALEEDPEITMMAARIAQKRLAEQGVTDATAEGAAFRGTMRDVLKEIKREQRSILKEERKKNSPLWQSLVERWDAPMERVDYQLPMRGPDYQGQLGQLARMMDNFDARAGNQKAFGEWVHPQHPTLHGWIRKLNNDQYRVYVGDRPTGGVGYRSDEVINRTVGSAVEARQALEAAGLRRSDVPFNFRDFEHLREYRDPREMNPYDVAQTNREIAAAINLQMHEIGEVTQPLIDYANEFIDYGWRRYFDVNEPWLLFGEDNLEHVGRRRVMDAPETDLARGHRQSSRFVRYEDQVIPVATDDDMARAIQPNLPEREVLANLPEGQRINEISRHAKDGYNQERFLQFAYMDFERELRGVDPAFDPYGRLDWLITPRVLFEEADGRVRAGFIHRPNVGVGSDDMIIRTWDQKAQSWKYQNVPKDNVSAQFHVDDPRSLRNITSSFDANANGAEILRTMPMGESILDERLGLQGIQDPSEFKAGLQRALRSMLIQEDGSSHFITKSGNLTLEGVPEDDIINLADWFIRTREMGGDPYKRFDEMLGQLRRDDIEAFGYTKDFREALDNAALSRARYLLGDPKDTAVDILARAKTGVDGDFDWPAFRRSIKKTFGEQTVMDEDGNMTQYASNLFVDELSNQELMERLIDTHVDRSLLNEAVDMMRAPTALSLWENEVGAMGIMSIPDAIRGITRQIDVRFRQMSDARYGFLNSHFRGWTMFPRTWASKHQTANWLYQKVNQVNAIRTREAKIISDKLRH
jgi:hypothetical protein